MPDILGMLRLALLFLFNFYFLQLRDLGAIVECLVRVAWSLLNHPVPTGYLTCCRLFAILWGCGPLTARFSVLQWLLVCISQMRMFEQRYCALVWLSHFHFEKSSLLFTYINLPTFQSWDAPFIYWLHTLFVVKPSGIPDQWQLQILFSSQFENYSSQACLFLLDGLQTGFCAEHTLISNQCIAASLPMPVFLLDFHDMGFEHCCSI